MIARLLFWIIKFRFFCWTNWWLDSAWRYQKWPTIYFFLNPESYLFLERKKERKRERKKERKGTKVIKKMQQNKKQRRKTIWKEGSEGKQKAYGVKIARVENFPGVGESLASLPNSSSPLTYPSTKWPTGNQPAGWWTARNRRQPDAGRSGGSRDAGDEPPTDSEERTFVLRGFVEKVRVTQVCLGSLYAKGLFVYLKDRKRCDNNSHVLIYYSPCTELIFWESWKAMCFHILDTTTFSLCPELAILLRFFFCLAAVFKHGNTVRKTYRKKTVLFHSLYFWVLIWRSQICRAVWLEGTFKISPSKDPPVWKTFADFQGDSEPGVIFFCCWAETKRTLELKQVIF